jgi:hypothetical protein
MINKEKMDRPILRQSETSTLATPLSGLFAQFAHKVIHRFCGQVGTRFCCEGLGDAIDVSYRFYIVTH